MIFNSDAEMHIDSFSVLSIAFLFYRWLFCFINVANIFELPSKDGNITPGKARKSRQMQFRDKTAYVWGLCYQWDPSLSRNPVPWFPHFMPPCWKLQGKAEVSLCKFALKLLILIVSLGGFERKTMLSLIPFVGFDWSINTRSHSMWKMKGRHNSESDIVWTVASQQKAGKWKGLIGKCGPS